MTWYDSDDFGRRTTRTSGRRARPTRDDYGRTAGPSSGRFIETAARDTSHVDMTNAKPGTTVKVYATVADSAHGGWHGTITSPASLAGRDVILRADDFCVTRRMFQQSGARTRICRRRMPAEGVRPGTVVPALALFIRSQDGELQERDAVACRWGLSQQPQHLRQSAAV